jgi:hypothetical protein
MTKNKKLAKEIGRRLKDFADKEYGSIPSLAKEIEMNQSQLQNYVYRKKNQPLPGAEVLLKLRKVGCDINWLLTGEKNKSNEARTKLPMHLFNKVMKKYGINSAEQLDEILDLFSDLKNKLIKID